MNVTEEQESSGRKVHKRSECTCGHEILHFGNVAQEVSIYLEHKVPCRYVCNATLPMNVCSSASYRTACISIHTSCIKGVHSFHLGACVCFNYLVCSEMLPHADGAAVSFRYENGMQQLIGNK